MSKTIPGKDNHTEPYSRPLSTIETQLLFDEYPELEGLLGTEYRLEYNNRMHGIRVVGPEVDLGLKLFLAISKMA